MADYFADTGYWVALLNNRDYLHDKAVQISGALTNHRIVTTEMVLTELLNYASAEGEYLRRVAADTAAALLNSTNVEVIPQTSSQFHRALERFRNRLDQSWSLVDCASFIIMEEQGIQEALAFDHHFQQAGFTALLRDSD